MFHFAKLAVQAAHNDEQAGNMYKVGQAPAELFVEERNLMSVADKNTDGSRRVAW